MKLAKVALVIATFVRLFAFKPFYYEDASVEERGRMELEVGIFSYERENGEDFLEVPTIKVDLGIFKNTELGMEYKFLHHLGHYRLAEINLFAKEILLKWKGVILGWEGGVFLPAYPSEKMGGQGLLMAGIKWGGSVFHLNLGWVKEKEGQGEYFFSAIWMGPFFRSIRPVGEFTYQGNQPSLLLGFMLERGWGGLGFGIRRGINPSFFSIILGVSKEFP